MNGYPVDDDYNRLNSQDYWRTVRREVNATSSKRDEELARAVAEMEARKRSRPSKEKASYVRDEDIGAFLQETFG